MYIVHGTTYARIQYEIEKKKKKKNTAQKHKSKQHVFNLLGK